MIMPAKKVPSPAKKAKEIKPSRIPEMNIGLIGHVDHGKTSLTQALTGKWTDTHSEEIKRGITIRLGYADASFYYCAKCKKYSSSEKCPSCFSDSEYLRTVSFVDAPGHETLMATVLSAASLMDAALLIIAANEECPQPQTTEHLKVLDLSGIRSVIIVQNKIDLVTIEQARKNHDQIKKFVKDTIAETAPVIPVSAAYNANIDILIEAIQNLPTPKRDESVVPKFLVARSFDVNKPGSNISDLAGATLGGSLVKGVLKIGDSIEVVPGYRKNDDYIMMKGKIIQIVHGSEMVDVARPGGLLAIQTDSDPFIAKNDSLSGNVVSLENSGLEAVKILKIKPTLFDKEVKIKPGDVLMLTIGIAMTIGTVKSSAGAISIELKIPVAAEASERVSISKQLAGRWRLVGMGETIL